MNRQKIFDKVSKHLLKQGVKAYSSSNSCLYRNETGNKRKVLRCALGCLVYKRYYDKRMEGHGCENEFVHRALTLSGVQVESEQARAFLADLQEIHDSRDPSKWAMNLIGFAKKHNLNCSIPV